MHSSSAAHRLRVITSNLLKSIHGFRLWTVQSASPVSLKMMVVMVLLVGIQVVMWGTSMSTLGSRAIAERLATQGIDAQTNTKPVSIAQSPITRIEIPAAGIQTSVIGVEALASSGSHAGLVQMTRYAMGYHTDSGLPGQGKNIVFSAVAGDYGRIMSELDRVVPGSTITLYEGDVAYTYNVVSQQVIARNMQSPNSIETGIIGQSSHEQVTLITVWPPAGANRNTQYLVVTAKPTP